MTPLLMEQPKVDEEHEKIKEILMNYSKQNKNGKEAQDIEATVDMGALADAN